MNIINATPHEVVIYDDVGNLAARVPPSGQVARVPVVKELVAILVRERDGGFNRIGRPVAWDVGATDDQEWLRSRLRPGDIPIYATVLQTPSIEGLPEYSHDTLVIVSRPVFEACRDKGRPDLVVPGEAVRDENGNVVGCVGLSR